MNTIQENSYQIVFIDTNKLTLPKATVPINTGEASEKFMDYIDALQTKGGGMNAFPIEVYNTMLNHMLTNGKLRNAMFFVCMANWGMRYSDAVRVRFCHILERTKNSELVFRENFKLPNGEKKTGKNNIYYNNEATKAIIRLYLSKNPYKKIYDYLFTSESGNSKAVKLSEIEAGERSGKEIKNLTKIIESADKRIDGLLKLYANQAITEEEFSNMKGRIIIEKSKAEQSLKKINSEIKSTAENPDEQIYVQTPISSTAAENIIKDTLEEIRIVPINRKNKMETVNIKEKYNTHSLRKVFSESFYAVGKMLHEAGEIDIDQTSWELLVAKMMHSSGSITSCYNKINEKAFEKISKNLNIGLEEINNFLGSFNIV
jgi:hypothetical protein